MFLCKHRIIVNEMSSIIFAKQMHHIAVGDASLKLPASILFGFTNAKDANQASFFALVRLSGTRTLRGQLALVIDYPKALHNDYTILQIS